MWAGLRGRGSGWGERTYLKVSELQELVGLALLKVSQHRAAGLRLTEGGQALLAALETLRPAQHAAEEAQLGVAGSAGGHGSGRSRAAVAVAEGLAVAQQTVQPQAHLQVAHALGPVLAAVLVERVAVGRLERHQLVPREAAEAVALVLCAPRWQHAPGTQQYQQRGRRAAGPHRAWPDDPSPERRTRDAAGPGAEAGTPAVARPVRQASPPGDRDGCVLGRRSALESERWRGEP